MSDQLRLYSSLLNNNDCLPETVIQDVRRSLHQALTELEGIEAQIQTFRHQTDIIKQTIAQYNVILSPIRAISDDVLSEIFTHTIQLYGDDTTPSPKQHGKSNPPVLFTHICRRWREVALSTPTLWAKISIKLPSILSSGNSTGAIALSTASAPRQCHLLTQEADRVQQWIKRAGALPISFSISQGTLTTFGAWMQEPQPLNLQLADKLSWIFEIISAYLPQCERLHFSLPNEHVYQLFSAHVTPENIRHITYFKPDIYTMHETLRQQTVLRSPLFMALPALRSLHLPPPMTFLIPQEDTPSSFAPDTWKNLTHLSADGFIALPQAAVIFEHCPELVELQLLIAEDGAGGIIPGGVPGGQTQSKEVLAPSLKSLKLEFRPNFLQVSGGWQSAPPAPAVPVCTILAPHLELLQYTVRQYACFDGIGINHDNPSLDFTSKLPLDHILRSAENLTDLTITGRKVKEEGFCSTLHELGVSLARLYIGTNKDNDPPYIFQEYIDNGYNLTSETDAAFQSLFPVPEWCKLPSLCTPVPLTEIEGLDTDELDRAIEDQICPQLEHLELSGLQSTRPASLLSFIVCRLRLYEYARHRRGEGNVPVIRHLASLNATILGRRDIDDPDISETIQNLATAVGVKFKLNVTYPVQKPHCH